MPAWGWAAVVWGSSLPAAFAWTRRQGLLPRGDPIVLFRVPIVAFLAPALVLAALVAGLAGLRRRRAPPGA
jgi:hypothetical protein